VKNNVGNVDRLARMLFGMTILGLGLAYHSWWGLLGVVPLLTAALRWCPAYLPLGLNTCRVPVRVDEERR
jgi:hypothetical protein